jgi:rRNA maturation protein Nop10
MAIIIHIAPKKERFSPHDRYQKANFHRTRNDFWLVAQ